MSYMYALILLALIADCRIIKFRNNENKSIWIAIQGDAGKENLRNGGFAMKQQAFATVNVDDDWSGRIWARTLCNQTTNHCETGDCGNKLECDGAGFTGPATVVQLKFNGSTGIDNYRISLIDGFNVKVSVEPVEGFQDGTKYSCKKATCHAPINRRCPEALRFTGDENQKIVIGCNSACETSASDDDCCHGNATCTETETSYIQFFKSECPDALAYANDNESDSLFYCKANQYLVCFG